VPTAYVFDETVDFFANNFIAPFPCNLHIEKIDLHILESYITMRMRQHFYLSNKSGNRTKKSCRLVSTSMYYTRLIT